MEEDTRVPAGHEMLVPGSVKTRENLTEIGLVDPAENGELSAKGLLIARVLVEVGDSSLPIKNFQPKPK